MLSNAYLLAKFRFDTAENERHFAEIWPKKLTADAGCDAGRPAEFTDRPSCGPPSPFAVTPPSEARMSERGLAATSK